MLFSIVVAPFYLPTHTAQGFQSFHILTNICYFLFFFDSSYPNGYKVRFVFYLTKSSNLLCSKCQGMHSGGWRMRK